MNVLPGRIEFIDISKTIAIAIVVLGHAIVQGTVGPNRGIIFDVIYSFHMPLFFVISGYIYEKNGKKVSMGILASMLWRFVVVSLVWHTFYTLVFKTPASLFNDPISFYVNYLLYPDSPWFLMVFFGATLLYLVSKMVSRNYKWYFFCTLFFCVVYLLIKKQNFPILDFALLTRSLYYSIFIFMGSMLFLFRDYLLAKKIMYIYVLSFLCLFLVRDLGGYYSQFCIDLILAALGSIVVVITSVYISEFFCVNCFFLWIGSRTLHIYLLNGLFYSVGVFDGVLRIVSCFVANVLLSVAVVALFEKIAKRNKCVDCMYMIFFGKRVGLV